MSVDLVGSTAFKNKAGSAILDAGVELTWSKQIKHFYSDLPLNLKSKFDSRAGIIEGKPYSNGCPRVWKTVGDEILLVCRVIDVQHLIIALISFLDAVKDYGYWLDKQQPDLDVKGAAWISAFPHPNITVQIANDDQSYSVTQNDRAEDESFEADADKNPSRYDFLGNSMDAGFRIAKFAERDKLVMSLELVYLVSKYSHIKSVPSKLIFVGKHILKGVFSETPYPIIALDAERSADRRELRSREADLLPKANGDAVHFNSYAELFLRDVNAELPILSFDSDGNSDISFPSSYLEFSDRWIKEEEANEKTSDLQIEAESQDEDGTGNLDESKEFLTELIKILRKSSPSQDGTG